MQIGGLQKVSLIDYPGKIAAIVFTQGCNFRCPYCHNKELVHPKFFKQPIDQEEVLEFLKKRIGKLDAVSITGGEPLLQKDLEKFVGRIKVMDYLIKIDTNGSFPKQLASLLKSGLVDYVAMDIKAPFEKYRKLVNAKADVEKIKQSIALIMNSGLEYEFRTTYTNQIASEQDIQKILESVKGSKTYFLQKSNPVDDKEYVSEGDMEAIKNVLDSGVGRLVGNYSFR